MMKIVFSMMLMMYESKGHRLLEVDFNLSQERSLKCWRGQHILNFERKHKDFNKIMKNVEQNLEIWKKIPDSLLVILVPSLLINMSAPHTQLVVFSGWLTSFLLFSCFSVLWQLFVCFATTGNVWRGFQSPSHLNSRRVVDSTNFRHNLRCFFFSFSSITPQHKMCCLFTQPQTFFCYLFFITPQQQTCCRFTKLLA